MYDEIVLRAMRFQALVGILPHELTTPQPIEIDLMVHSARLPPLRKAFCKTNH